MQVLLSIPNDYFEDECSPAFAYKERKKLEEKYDLRPADSVEVVNIGPGADLLVILATIATAAWSIFQLPGTIKSSLEGWEWLVKKLKTYKKNKILVSLDLDAAGMLSIDYLADKYGEDSSFELMDAYDFNIVDISGMFPGREDGLAARPHNYYVFSFRIAGRVIILSVRSTGEIRQLETFLDMPYGLSDIDSK